VTGAWHVVYRNFLVYRRVWRGSLFLSFLQPVLFLTAMGIGVGSLVDRGDTSLLGGMNFLHFLAPGLLAAACMQTASFEASFPITGKLVWHRNYEAINATPMRVRDIVLGELLWMGVRLSMVASAFTLVITAFAIPRSPLAVFAIPAAILTGLAFAAPIVAYSATRKRGASFNGLFRFVITPLFLFSGVFFPVTRLPEALQTFAWFTPLFHGVELVRGLVLGREVRTVWFFHAAYLVLLAVTGAIIAARNFRTKLQA
jgi:lipooligosaccharide transport system permease protein